MEDNIELNSDYREDLLNGIVAISGKIHYLQKSQNNIFQKLEKNFLAIPYYAWANRGKGEMSIWIIRDLKAFGKSLG